MPICSVFTSTPRSPAVFDCHTTLSLALTTMPPNNHTRRRTPRDGRLHGIYDRLRLRNLFDTLASPVTTAAGLTLTDAMTVTPRPASAGVAPNPIKPDEEEINVLKKEKEVPLRKNRRRETIAGG